MLHLKFDEKKTTQAATYLLKKLGGRMPYIKLIKLLYLADRSSLVNYGRPITFDNHVAMPHGPVLSQTYDLISVGVEPGTKSYWNDHIARHDRYDVQVKKHAGETELSEIEIQTLDEIFKKYGRLASWKIVKLTHELPEWKDPQGSSYPIPVHAILRAENKTEEEISEIEEELKNFTHAQSLLTE